MAAESNLADQDFQIDTEGRQHSQRAPNSSETERLSLLRLNEWITGITSSPI